MRINLPSRVEQRKDRNEKDTLPELAGPEQDVPRCDEWVVYGALRGGRRMPPVWQKKPFALNTLDRHAGLFLRHITNSLLLSLFGSENENHHKPFTPVCYATRTVNLLGEPVVFIAHCRWIYEICSFMFVSHGCCPTAQSGNSGGCVSTYSFPFCSRKEGFMVTWVSVSLCQFIINLFMLYTE